MGGVDRKEWAMRGGLHGSGGARPAEPRSQAVDKVVDILEMLAESPVPLALDQIAAGTQNHRSVTYRLLRTLESRRLVDHTPSGYRLGELMLVLANAVHSDLRDASLAELTRLAGQFGATAFITVDDGGRSVCLQTVEPEKTLAHVAIRPGVWGPMDVGAPAIAILSGRAATPLDSAEVTHARAAGYAKSSGTEYDARGLEWVAAPVISAGSVTRASVCVVFPRGALDADEVGSVLSVSARNLGRSLSS